MSDEKKALFQKLMKREISREQFISSYLKNEEPNDEYFERLLDNAVTNRDEEKLEEALIVINIGYHNLASLSPVFCQLLKEDWHYKHEDLAMLLSDIKDPSTANCLCEATELQYSYLDYDDTYQFARKCIKGISAIGDNNAINKLQQLAESKNITIAGYARKELGYKGLL